MDLLTLLRDYEADTGVPAGTDVEVSDAGTDERYLAATLPVRALAVGAVGAFAAALNRYRTALGLAPTTHSLRLDRITASFSGDRLLRIDGEPVDGFAPLSGFFETADGWVRTHANYPHHRTRLLDVLDLPEDSSRDDVATRIAGASAADLERAAAGAGAILVRVRDESEWSASESGADAAWGPLLRLAPRTDSVVTDRVATTLWGQPLAGVRVLDLTRVVAGPTATRALALLGAQVLRIDPPELPEIAPQHTETGQGKRTAFLDVRVDSDTARDLLGRADVVVAGYRPGALAGFTADAPDAQPGIVRASVCAWGERGPWAQRRGFDSIVQAASGIALIEGGSAPGGRPGALPAQALDHATGYLLAAGIVDALAGRVADSRGRDVRASLARTAAWLLAAPGRDPQHPKPLLPTEGCVVTHDTDEGTVQTARPALAEYDDYPYPAHPLGSDKPEFAD